MSDLTFWQSEAENNPDDPYTLAVYAFHLQGDQQSKKALKVLNKCLDINPSYAKARALKGTIHLSIGEYEIGWSENEYWRDDYETYKKVMWNGEETSEEVMVWDDQGYGDCIQYLRYIPMVKERCPNLTLVVKPELCSLVAQSFPHVHVQSDIARIYKHCGITSLPYIFHTLLDTIPQNIPYLMAFIVPPSARIGICWYSNSHHEKKLIKMIPIEYWQPILDKYETVRLQQEDLRVDTFAETAAIIQGLDLVITIDTSIAHLAGALGKPTWILLPKDCDWRWGQNRTDSPWYPSARLFRQKKAGNWSTVIDKVLKVLDSN